MISRIKYLIAPVVFVMIFGALYETGLLNIFYVRSMCRPIYVPLISWTLVLVYSVFIRLTFPKKSVDAAGTIRWAVILGFAVSIYSALFSLVVSLSKDHSFLSAYYLYYVIAVLAVLTLVLSFASASILSRIRGDRRGARAYKYALLMPAFLLPFYLAVFYADVVGKMIFVLLIGACFIPYIFIKTTVLSSVVNAFGKAARFIFKNDKNFIIFLFLLSFAFRAAFAVNIVYKTEAPGGGNFVLASDDGDTYDRVAREIVDGKRGAGFPKVEIWGGFWDEGYSLFLAAIYKIFGRNFYIVTILQSFIGAFLPVLVFLIGRTLFSRAVGIFASIGMSLRTPPIFLSAVLGHEALWLPLILLYALMLSFEYRSKVNNYIYIITAGTALGLVCIFRGLYLYFLPFSCLWILIFWCHKTIAQRLKTIAVLAAALLFITILTSVVFHSPISGGSKDRITSLWQLERNSLDHFNKVGNNRLIEIGVNLSMDVRGSLINIARDPVKFIRVCVEIYPARILGYLQFYQFGFFDPVYLINSARWNNDFMPTLEFYFTIFFISGLFFCINKRRVLTSPVFMVLAYNILVYSVIFYYMAPRHRDASLPFIYIIGAFGLVTILKRLDILSDGN